MELRRPCDMQWEMANDTQHRVQLTLYCANSCHLFFRLLIDAVFLLVPASVCLNYIGFLNLITDLLSLCYVIWRMFKTYTLQDNLYYGEISMFYRETDKKKIIIK